MIRTRPGRLPRIFLFSQQIRRPGAVQAGFPAPSEGYGHDARKLLVWDLN
jgi:hypothetical protein